MAAQIPQGGRCIAMWSGPRNISTAMMRAWENRPDTQVIDEPFYAHFLSHTGMDHPMREQILQSGTLDWRDVVEQITTRPSTGIFYQKHISSHWLPHYSTDWLSRLDHVFLIREPEPVVASYAIKRNGLTVSDLGYSQQAALFDLVSEFKGRPPIVIDSGRFLADPAGQLRTVCQDLDIPYDDCMLRWPAGPRTSDGVWGAHWYDAVNRSTGFAAPRKQAAQLNHDQMEIAQRCRPFYEALLSFAI